MPGADTTLKTEELVLNMGPQHPSTHGVLRLELHTDGEIVREMIPHIGYLHRCFEKHAENVPYDEVVPYTDRMDYVASMNNNLGYAVAMVAPTLLLALRDRRFAALGALGLMIAGTVSGVRYELRERDGAGALTALLAGTWVASIATAWAAHHYGIF